MSSNRNSMDSASISGRSTTSSAVTQLSPPLVIQPQLPQALPLPLATGYQTPIHGQSHRLLPPHPSMMIRQLSTAADQIQEQKQLMHSYQAAENSPSRFA